MIGSDTLKSVELIKERIKQHGKSQIITELCLDEIQILEFSPQMSRAVQKCTNLTHLSLSSCQLASLKYFPSMKTLQYLDLQQNSFQQQNVSDLCEQFQSLGGLNLSKNHINDLQMLVQLVNRLSLKQLNIFQTPVFKSTEKIVQKLFECCKTLQCVNWQDRRGKEVKQFGHDFSQSENQSENNGKSYSEDEQIQNSISMNPSKKIKHEQDYIKKEHLSQFI